MFWWTIPAMIILPIILMGSLEIWAKWSVDRETRDWTWDDPRWKEDIG
jgi:hypothetical protein